MPVLHDVRGQIMKYDRQILDLLEARAKVCRDMREAGEGFESEGGVLDRWMEEALDHGLDELALERVCRAVLGLCRRSSVR